MPEVDVSFQVIAPALTLVVAAVLVLSTTALLTGSSSAAPEPGAYVALVDAVRWMQAKRDITKNPIIGAVAAVSVGIYRGTPVLDLDYAEDSDCDTDMNVVMNDGGGFIELQGTAEGHAFRRDELDALLVLASQGCTELFAAQQAALAAP